MDDYNKDNEDYKNPSTQFPLDKSKNIFKTNKIFFRERKLI